MCATRRGSALRREHRDIIRRTSLEKRDRARFFCRSDAEWMTIISFLPLSLSLCPFPNSHTTPRSFSLSSRRRSFFLLVHSHGIYLVIVSFTAAGRPLGLFSPLRILHGELGRQRDIIKARMTPLLALLFIEIYTRARHAVAVCTLVDSPTMCVWCTYVYVYIRVRVSLH